MPAERYALLCDDDARKRCVFRAAPRRLHAALSFYAMHAMRAMLRATSRRDDARNTYYMPICACAMSAPRGVERNDDAARLRHADCARDAMRICYASTRFTPRDHAAICFQIIFMSFLPITMITS